jgi:hypothetical protein
MHFEGLSLDSRWREEWPGMDRAEAGKAKVIANGLEKVSVDGME